MNLKLNIFKDKLSLKKDQQDTKNESKNLDLNLEPAKENTVDPIIDSPEKMAPQFMSLSKIEFEKFDVRAGLIKDPSAKGGIRYQIIEPTLSERDEKALEIIKKLLMTELSVSMGEIKSKREAEHRLGTKIEKMIKNYRLKIPKKNIAKIKYYAIRDFIHLGKIEPLMRDHMIEEVSCDGTGIPIYVWHREHESIPTNIIYKKDAELNNFARKLAYICGKHVSMAD
ncbi:MAG: type IV secretory pathway protein, partial [Candidatus Nitrosomaritimum yanchengensis]